MFIPQSFEELCQSMKTGAEVIVRGKINGRFGQATGIINSISRDDGSGRKWLVKVTTIVATEDINHPITGKDVVVFVDTNHIY